ncbi:MAG: ABC transporter permease [Clostridium argentinense]|uniref:ABC transporter permease n=1 Tax=Clostridium faecium TaxID=2762223 RepID=A0ABR8YR28_9CLOT|nr:ABC transporter permease [Clostridium faecium]MBD8046709.1 ABC transporter permease [Clostridium faecium]MBS5823988.1 ABC transporter permease [Clostridium argentinense]
MKKYFLKRILTMVPVFVGLSIIIFVLINIAPGDPYMNIVEGQISISASDTETALNAIGYYDPVHLKYVKWMGKILKGDMGTSIRYNEPVVDIIKRRISNTFLLSIVTLILTTLIALPLGIASATKPYSFKDKVLTILALIGISIPGFFIALVIIKIFAINLGWFPISGLSTVGEKLKGFDKFIDVIKHMILPVISMTILEVASLMRYTRSAMLDVFNQNYIRTARAKGLNEKIIIYKHAFRNALIPIVTLLSMSLGYIVAGTILIETIFVWPGMGTLFYQAIANRDYPLVMGCAMILSSCILLANLISDIVYCLVDPRIRFK